MPNSAVKKIPITAETLGKGDFHVVARAISAIENSSAGAEELLKSLPNKQIPIIGITGPPGAGKSTLADALIKKFTEAGKKLAVLCIDPSSSFHSGALLGDRIRMNRWYKDPNIYIRSLASRGVMGGLNPRIFQITDLLSNAGFDYIMIETVGVGQTEIEITRLADQVILVLVPESGDDIQTLKSGIMEVGDIYVVNKSDRPGAQQFLASLKSSVHFQTLKGKEEKQFFQTIASEEKGVNELYEAILKNINALSPHRAVQMLFQKVWQFMVEYRMRGINPDDLRNELETEMTKKEFNLYRFSESYAREHLPDTGF